MKIAIDLTSLYGRKKTGVELYAIDLYRALLATNHIIVPIVHVKNEIDNNPHTYTIKSSPRLWLENYKLSQAIKNINADIAFFPVFPPPVDCYFGNTKIVPTLHDFAFLKFRNTINFAAKFYLTPKMLWAFRKADAIITISETVLHELKLHTKVPVFNCGENISKDYVTAKDKVNLTNLEKWGLKENGYIISVSTIEPRKNFKYLIKVVKPVLEKTNRKLVLVGRKGWGHDNELKGLIEDLGERLVFTDYVSNECLFSLYRYAYAFALLSLDEGFGRTPFEAVACGCKRVILSDIPIFRETFGNEGLFLPLHNENEAAQKLLYNQISLISEGFSIPFDILEQRIKLVIAKIASL